MKGEITYAEKYDPAMQITDQAAADAYFEECVAHTMSFGKTREQAEAIERGNLGYWAGYFTHATRERVERLFKCAHPIFGKIAEEGPPSPEAAYEAGLRIAAKSRDAAALLTKVQRERGEAHGGEVVAMAAAAKEEPPRHEPWCDADGAHAGDCRTAVRLARLQAFAEAVRDEFHCTAAGGDASRFDDGHVDDCWHCYAEQALEAP